MKRMNPNPQNLDGLLIELSKKKTYYEDQLKKIDAVLHSLRGIDGITDHPVEIWTREQAPGKISYTHGNLSPHVFVRDYIRRKGTEVSTRELFAEYYKATGATISANKKERAKQYNRFIVRFATRECTRSGFTRRIYRLEGVGRETYINVGSAIQLQKGPTVQNPLASSKEIV